MHGSLRGIWQSIPNTSASINSSASNSSSASQNSNSSSAICNPVQSTTTEADCKFEAPIVKAFGADSQSKRIQDPNPHQSVSIDANSSHAPTTTKTCRQLDPGVHQVSSIKGVNESVVAGYGMFVSDRIKRGWSCDLLTILFQHLPGRSKAVTSYMKDEVEKVYSTFVTRVNRKPRAAKPDQLPIMIAAADLPVYKVDRTSSPLIRCNDGLHVHLILLVPPNSRLKESVHDHFNSNAGLYSRSSIQSIHVRPVTHSPERVVDYVFKTVKNGRISYDEAVLVLPRAPSELGRRGSN